VEVPLKEGEIGRWKMEDGREKRGDLRTGTLSIAACG
jgi:hypothetical protein